MSRKPMGLCSNGCGIRSYSKGLCQSCYEKRRRQAKAQGTWMPEPEVYQPDQGCDLAPSCLTCPFVVCRHDVNMGKKQFLRVYGGMG